MALPGPPSITVISLVVFQRGAALRERGAALRVLINAGRGRSWVLIVMMRDAIKHYASGPPPGWQQVQSSTVESSCALPETPPPNSMETDFCKSTLTVSTLSGCGLTSGHTMRGRERKDTSDSSWPKETRTKVLARVVSLENLGCYAIREEAK